MNYSPIRRRRQSLLSSEAEDTGVVCKPDPRYAKVCAIAYSDSDNLDRDDPNPTDVAIAEPKATTPETTTPEAASQLPEPEPSNNTATSEPEVEAKTEAETTPDTLAEAEAEAETTPDTLAEAKTEAETTPDTPATAATLPVPPLPQVPTTSADEERPNEPEKADLEAEMEIARAESEIEQEQQELANDDLEEVIEDSELDEPESDSEVEESELDESEEFDSEELEAELETEESPVAIEDPAPEVAINTETAGFSEKIEQGALEEGDRVIADDGSLYDFYPLQGKAGESFTIYLESEDFDAFVALVDSSGKTVGENDDISQEDSNSQIEITLPADGVYNVIVNTYDEKGTGEYTLKVSR